MGDTGDVPVLLLGGGGHGLVAAEALAAAGNESVVFIDPNVGRCHELTQLGYQTRAERSISDRLLEETGARRFHVSVGRGQADLRQALFAVGVAAGLVPMTIIHPSAYVAPSAMIGAGSLVGPGAIVHVRARIGANCIVNSRALCEHDVSVGDHCHLAPGSVLCGGVSIREATTIGAGAVVRELLSIGAGATIGMGAVVVESVADGVTVFGNPARRRN